MKRLLSSQAAGHWFPCSVTDLVMLAYVKVEEEYLFHRIPGKIQREDAGKVLKKVQECSVMAHCHYPSEK